MSVSGLCQVCQSAEAEFHCDSCGNLVCAEHFDRSAGRCALCKDAGGGRRL